MENKMYEHEALASSDVELSSSSEMDGLHDPMPRHRRQRRWPPLHYIVYGILALSNLLFFSLYWRARRSGEQCVRPKLIYSPAAEAIEYIPKRLMRDLKNNPFTGEPNDEPTEEFDKAWAHLLEPMTIKISADELSHLPDDSIAMQDGSGYIAELTVYHELHCIKRIRRHFHQQRYYGNMTEDEHIREETHIDHCLEYWREAAICRGDVTLSTFQWLEGKPFSRVYSDHECVNFEKLDTWARSRMVDTKDLSVLAGRPSE
ncbi:hypothetical protein Trisim1_008744 [Trichoderma cf. simile WF8]